MKKKVRKNVVRLPQKTVKKIMKIRKKKGQSQIQAAVDIGYNAVGYNLIETGSLRYVFPRTLSKLQSYIDNNESILNSKIGASNEQ